MGDLTKITEPAAREAAGLPRPVKLVLAGLLALGLLCASGVAWVLVSQHGQISTQQGQIDELKQHAGDADTAAGQLAEQVRGLGAVPVVEPPAPTASTARPAVDEGTVRSAARSAVLEYCGQPTQPCRGPDGAAPPVDAIVAQVVAKIPLPRNGTDGSDGSDGKDAPPVSTAELAAQVATYCAQPDEPCRGKPGADGANGANGRGIVSHEYVLTDSGCVERTYYDQPPSPVDVPVGAALCASSSDTTTTESTTTTSSGG